MIKTLALLSVSSLVALSPICTSAAITSQSSTSISASKVEQKSSNPYLVHSQTDLIKMVNQMSKLKKPMKESDAVAHSQKILKEASAIFGKTKSQQAYDDFLTKNGFIVYETPVSGIEKTSQSSYNVKISPNYAYNESDAGDITLGNPSWSYDYVAGIWSVSTSFNWAIDQGWYNDYLNGSEAGQDEFGLWFSNLSYSTVASGYLHTYWGDGTQYDNVSYPNYTPASGSDLSVIYSGSDAVTRYSGANAFNGYEYNWESGVVALTMKSSFAGLDYTRSCTSVFYHTAESETINGVGVSTTGVNWSTNTTGYGWNAQSYSTSY